MAAFFYGKRVDKSYQHGLIWKQIKCVGFYRIAKSLVHHLPGGNPMILTTLAAITLVTAILLLTTHLAMARPSVRMVQVRLRDLQVDRQAVPQVVP